MKVKKLSIVIILVIAIMLLMTKFAYADSISVNMKSNTISYKRGETVTISISLSNIDSSTGISKLSGTFGYDTKVFEKIDPNSNLISSSGWERAEYNSDTNAFSIKATTPVKTSQVILKISLRVKNDAKLGDTFLMLNDLKASNGQEDISTSPATLNISIKESTSSNNTSSTTNIPNITTIQPGTVNIVTTPSAKTTSSPIAKQSPVASVSATPVNGNLPQTGIDDINEIMMVVGAVMISIGTFIMYRRNCK